MSLTGVPIVEQYVYEPSADELSRIQRAVKRIRLENPQLCSDWQFSHLFARSLEPAPALHVDDFSEIGGIAGRFDVRYLQDRARLRAGDAEFLVSGWPETPGYEEYCNRVLGLGSVQWLRPFIARDSARVAGACWQDREIRRQLIHAARCDGLRYVHPHMGTFGVWELADLLHRSSRQPVYVIAPPPELCRLVNNKVLFSRIVAELLGENSVPATRSAWNRTSLATQLRELAHTSTKLGIKLPDSTGSRGNVVLDAEPLRNRSTEEVFTMLNQILGPIPWDGRQRLLVDCWETDVLSSPSVQLWIPPIDEGRPILEGFFDQQMTGVEKRFVGTRPARLTSALQDELVAGSTLLAILFQRLGYVGRCSFDTIITGKDYQNSRIEFIECNGRWGGTSLPMTMMNRLFGDWQRRAFLTANIGAPGLKRVPFALLLKQFQQDLLNATTGEGSLALFTPGRILVESAIDVLITADTLSAALDQCDTFAERLRQWLPQPHLPRSQTVQQKAGSNGCVC